MLPTFGKGVISCNPGKIRTHFAGSKVLRTPLPLKFNHFQSMNLIVLVASPLLADDHRKPASSIYLVKSSTCTYESGIVTSSSLLSDCSRTFRQVKDGKRKRDHALLSFRACAAKCFSCQSSANTSQGMLTVNLLRNYESGLPGFGAQPKIIL